jgi:hypothetical protein
MTNKLNVYQKLQKVRVALLKKNLKKSGQNTYSKFSYYELGDFLPQLNELNDEAGLATRFYITDKVAVLEIIDSEKPEDIIKFSSPTAEVEIGLRKDGTGGAEPIQNLGGKITYMRRYLLMIAFEIVESDYVDRQKQEGKELPEKYVNKIYACKDLEELNKVAKEIQIETKKKYQKSLLEAYTLKKSELSQIKEVVQK